MNKFFVFIYLILATHLSSGQDYFKISGRVLDNETKQPLYFASICIAGNRIGTVSNINGNFLLKIPNRFKEDTLYISFMGFTPRKILLTEIHDFYIEVALEPMYFHVKEVVIRSFSPKEIIKQAIAKIPENYPEFPVNFLAFYREDIRENGKYIQFIEAVLGIYKGSYNNKKDNDCLKIIKGRQKLDVIESLIWDYIKFINGPYEMIRSDVAKYPTNFITVAQSKINFLNEKHFKYYDYQLLRKKRKENDDIYVIEFKPKKIPKKALFEGYICIDRKTLAFTSLNYTFSANRINKAKIISPYTENQLNEIDVYIKAIDFFNIVKFKPYGGKWYLSNSKMEYHFLFIEKNQNYLSHITNVIDFVVTDIDSSNVQTFKKKNYIKMRQSLTEQLGEFDEEFWGNYNFIKENKF